MLFSIGQRADGLFGPIIVRQANDSLQKFYDIDSEDHVIVINDWTSSEAFSFKENSHDYDSLDSILINGRGSHTDENSDQEYKTPKAVFYIDRNLRYRFRLINAGVYNCPVEFSIEEHLISVISTDGSPIQPVEVDSVILFAGLDLI